MSSTPVWTSRSDVIPFPFAPKNAPSSCSVARGVLPEGEKWRREMLAYVEDNIRFVEAYCRDHLPAVRPVRPEASFLVWLDCRRLGLNREQLLDLFVDKAHLALNDGEMFGMGGAGFMRLNVGTPRAVLEQAMRQLAEAIAQL